MNALPDMVWIEARKAVQSRMALWTGFGSLFFPLGIAFLLFVARNPEISQKLGIVSAKANLVAYAAVDWPTYLNMYAQLIGTGGFILFILIVSWVFGREFTDGTVKDWLAVPVARASILLAKMVLVALWAAGLTLVILAAGLVVGSLMALPGGSPALILEKCVPVLVAAGLAILLVLPFAFFASAGRGYLLPIGLAFVTLFAANLAIILGRGEYFPWAVAGLYAQGKTPLGPASYAIVAATFLVGVLATYLWWQTADQK
ncbi:MAG TPA: ABC transporter permease [Anaerolineaceae bacterium]|nr:ABC transporter permease [Anaerolineaceae bacterium]